MNDTFERTNPASGAYQIAALSDSADVPNVGKWRGLYYGGAAANIAVICFEDNVAVTFKNVQPGTLLPISVRKVMNTNTTAAAADIVLVR